MLTKFEEKARKSNFCSIKFRGVSRKYFLTHLIVLFIKNYKRYLLIKVRDLLRFQIFK